MTWAKLTRSVRALWVALDSLMSLAFLLIGLVAAGLSQAPIAQEATAGSSWRWPYFVTLQALLLTRDPRTFRRLLNSASGRRLLSAARAGATVALGWTALDYASGIIDGRHALPWDAIPIVAPEVARVLHSSRTGLDLYFSPRVAAWAVISAALWVLLLRLNTYLAEATRQARLRREAEDTAVRARLAPHFIFDALDTVKAQMERDPSEAAATTDRLASLFRQVLAFSDRPFVTVREEVAFIETYLGIEQARLGSRLRVKLEILEDVEAVEIPPLSLQVLVENAVKHGVTPREEGGEIRIWARWDGEGSFRKLEVGVESPATAVASTAASAVAGTLASLRARLERPDDLSTGMRNERLLARFIWRGAQAWP